MSAAMQSLRPCPLCWGEAEYRRNEEPLLWSVDCDPCGIHTSWHPNIDDAARAWNKRPDRSAGPRLHPNTLDLVNRFCFALIDKLSLAEAKYGYSDGWLRSDWMDECRAKLAEHVAKGDPRDVAAYCAFLWHHGEKTVTSSHDASGVLAKIDAAIWTLNNDCGEPHAKPLREARAAVAELIAAASNVVARDATKDLSFEDVDRLESALAACGVKS